MHKRYELPIFEGQSSLKNSPKDTFLYLSSEIGRDTSVSCSSGSCAVVCNRSSGALCCMIVAKIIGCLIGESLWNCGLACSYTKLNLIYSYQLKSMHALGRTRTQDCMQSLRRLWGFHLSFLIDGKCTIISRLHHFLP